MADPHQPTDDDPAAMFARLARESDADDAETSDGADGQRSQAGSSFDDVGASAGGADAVPDTPDGIVEDNIGDVERDDYRRRGQDAESDRQDGSPERAGSDVSPASERG